MYFQKEVKDRQKHKKILQNFGEIQNYTHLFEFGTDTSSMRAGSVSAGIASEEVMSLVAR